MQRTETARGFTLIELLVVIAIIGLLSSVVLAALNGARTKAKEASVRTEVRQMATLMSLQYSETGSYTALLGGGPWRYTTAACSAGFSGTYATNARDICVSILSNTSDLYMGVGGAGAGKFTIMSRLPGKSVYFCMGSSGGNSDIDTGGWGSSGCYNNP